MKKDLYSQCTDTLRDISEVKGLTSDVKEEIKQVIEDRDRHYQENRQFVPKAPPAH